jgi:hypothetical protein
MYSTRFTSSSGSHLPHENQPVDDFSDRATLFWAISNAGMNGSRTVDSQEIAVMSEENATHGPRIRELFYVKRAE